MSSAPFCVIEKPYMIWGHDVLGDNNRFLSQIDTNLYYRVAHDIVGEDHAESSEEPNGADNANEQEREDVSTLSRLLWHHGMETLVMMLGAYIQAPRTAHAYFLKCKTEDAVELGGYLLRGECPKYHRLKGAPFSLTSLLSGIHHRAGWQDRETIVGRFTTALQNMLCDYVDEKHRWEYNSIKHGLRASHGHFGLAAGIEETPGLPARPEAMQMIGVFTRFELFRRRNAPRECNETAIEDQFYDQYDQRHVDTRTGHNGDANSIASPAQHRFCVADCGRSRG